MRLPTLTGLPIRDSCIPASYLGARDTHEPSPLSMLNVSVATHLGFNTDTSVICQRRYRVCAPYLCGSTIHCRVIALIWVLLP